MTALFLYDDARARTFAPFALTRPLSEMRVGTDIVRTRWERSFQVHARNVIAAPHLDDFDHVRVRMSGDRSLLRGVVIANSRFAPALDVSLPDGAELAAVDAWEADGRIAAVRTTRPVRWEELANGALALEALVRSGGRIAPLRGRWVEEVWQYVTELPAQLSDDIQRLGPTLRCADPSRLTVLGGFPVFVEAPDLVEQPVIFDATLGPILVRRGATIRGFTRLEGPCAIDEGTKVLGDRISGCSIGPHCVVRGEMSQTVMFAYSNKAHDGFVGHSYLGEWVNLGAGTITSNLKNTYGTVHLWTPSGVRDTGAVKLGSLLGDHVKTGIGTRLTTGCVVGAGSNIFGSLMPPKYVPPFSWGEGSTLSAYRLDRFLEVAARVMERRGFGISEAQQRQLAAAYALRLEGT